jgi:hypothetical protein
LARDMNPILHKLLRWLAPWIGIRFLAKMTLQAFVLD